MEKRKRRIVGERSSKWRMEERKEGRIFKFLCLPSGGRPPTSFSSISLFFLRALFSLFSWVTWLLQNNSKLRLTSYIIHHLKQVVYDKRFQSKYLMRWAYIMEGKKTNKHDNTTTLHTPLWLHRKITNTTSTSIWRRNLWNCITYLNDLVHHSYGENRRLT